MRTLVSSLVGLFLVAGEGCAASNGVLTIESGPPTGKSGNTGIYSVHIGERPTLTLSWKVGQCDYAIAHFEGTDYYEDCGPPTGGRFEWPMKFDKLASRESPLHVSVKAYSQQQRRDLMPVGGKLVESPNPLDSMDLLIASAAVFVEVYQSHVEIIVPGGTGIPDWTLSRLVLHPDGRPPCRIPHSGSGIAGFTVNGPNANHEYTIRYQPKASEVNHAGQTSAEFIVAEENGQTRTIATSIATP